MKIIIEGEVKEIAELANAIQAWLNSDKLNFSDFTDQLDSAIQDAVTTICDIAPEPQK